MNNNNENKINDHIVESEFSYWTIGYLISNKGAKKLYNKKYINNLIPVDEYLPLMYGKHNNNKLNILFSNMPKIKCYSFEPALIKPNNNAFSDSLTFSSKPYQYTNPNLTIVTVATDENDALKRFRLSCDYYGYKYVILGLDTIWKGGNMELWTGWWAKS